MNKIFFTLTNAHPIRHVMEGRNNFYFNSGPKKCFSSQWHTDNRIYLTKYSLRKYIFLAFAINWAFTWANTVIFCSICMTRKEKYWRFNGGRFLFQDNSYLMVKYHIFSLPSHFRKERPFSSCVFESVVKRSIKTSPESSLNLALFHRIVSDKST